MVGLVLGLQGGYTKYTCFLCLWDNQADTQHLVMQEWLLKQGLKSGLHNIQSHRLNAPNKILLLLLRIELVMKNFVKTVDREGSGFAFLQEKFPQISMDKLKASVFNSLQIREPMKDLIFDEALREAELSSFESLNPVVINFLGNHQSAEYEEIEELLKFLSTLGINVSQTAFSTVILGDLREELGEHFYQDIRIMEERNQGRFSVNFLADYCWYF